LFDLNTHLLSCVYHFGIGSYEAGDILSLNHDTLKKSGINPVEKDYSEESTDISALNEFKW
jgi:hypothetical protein